MATQVEWAQRLKQWEKSGQSAAEFGAREGIDAKRLKWWRWKLRSQPREPRLPAPVRFLPVHVVESPVPRGAPPAFIEVVLANGRVVRIAPGFDADTLGRVLAIAEAGPC